MTAIARIVNTHTYIHVCMYIYTCVCTKQILMKEERKVVEQAAQSA